MNSRPPIKPAAANEPFKHVIDEYKHQAQTITCTCGWHGSSADDRSRRLRVDRPPHRGSRQEALRLRASASRPPVPSLHRRRPGIAARSGSFPVRERPARRPASRRTCPAAPRPVRDPGPPADAARGRRARSTRRTGSSSSMPTGGSTYVGPAADAAATTRPTAPRTCGRGSCMPGHGRPARPPAADPERRPGCRAGPADLAGSLRLPARARLRRRRPRSAWRPPPGGRSRPPARRRRWSTARSTRPAWMPRSARPRRTGSGRSSAR